MAFGESFQKLITAKLGANMPDLTSAAASLYIFLKTHAPAIFGAIFSGQKVPRNNHTVVAWITTWVSVNAMGFFTVVVLSLYLGNFIAENRQLSEVGANFVRLIIGIWGIKLLKYFNRKIEPVMNELVDMGIEKLRKTLGLKPETHKEVLKKDD